jgi:pseudaminic acid synthase
MRSNNLFIVAELSCNHGGSLTTALETIEAAARAGADAVKFQTWQPESMCIDKSYVIKSGPWQGQNLAALYNQARTPWDWHYAMFDRARDCGLIAFSTPFDAPSLRMLESLDCPIYKVASFELVDHQLIRAIAKTGKPMIMSTGMATQKEVEMAAQAAIDAGCQDLTLLKCTSAYPAPPEEMNLRTMASYMQFMRWIRRSAYGLSDHTLGSAVAVAAVAMGASVIEKHFILDRRLGGPDAAFSMEPHEFKQMADDCRVAAKAIGDISYGPTASENTELRRSLYFARAMKPGETVQEQDLITSRPNLGADPYSIGAYLGKIITKEVQAGTPLTPDCMRREP